MNAERAELERLIKEILGEKLKDIVGEKRTAEAKEFAGSIIKVDVPKVAVRENDRLDTGNPNHRVYTHDLFSLKESERLGCGIMEMDHSAFDWTLDYDEIDYVIEGTLTIRGNGSSVTAEAGELILIPKGSHIQFSTETKTRFLYTTYPADWAGQNNEQAGE